MQSRQTVTPRYPTRQEIERGIERGRRAHARAVGAMARSLFRFLVGRKVKHIAAGRTAVQPTG